MINSQVFLGIIGITDVISFFWGSEPNYYGFLYLKYPVMSIQLTKILGVHEMPGKQPEILSNTRHFGLPVTR